MTRARLLLVDDHELFRESLARLLASEKDLAVVGQAGDGLAALQYVRDTNPDLVLMDIAMPVCNGLEATRLIHAAYPAVRILILTAGHDDENLFEALRAGARGYLLKSDSKTAFLQAIRQVLAGETVLSPKQATSVVRAYLDSVQRQTDTVAAKDDAGLTPREREVLELIAAGATNGEIAEQLSVGLYTVKTHVRSILQKLNAKSRREAARLAVRRGIVAGTREG